MFVQLNFTVDEHSPAIGGGGPRKVSLRRDYYLANNLNSYTVVESRGAEGNSIEKPLTHEEYKTYISESLDLQISEFCVYQDKLLNFKKNLAEVFESLSGSVNFK